jgi:hypothetical protein
MGLKTGHYVTWNIGTRIINAFVYPKPSVKKAEEVKYLPTKSMPPNSTIKCPIFGDI